MAKVLLPLIAAVRIIGALAIFEGMALNNHNNGTKKIKSRIQIKIMLMKVKTKAHLKTLLKCQIYRQ